MKKGRFVKIMLVTSVIIFCSVSAWGGIHNTHYGDNALGLFPPIAGDHNSAFGYYALSKNFGDHNSAFGCYALSHNIEGSYNTASGRGALARNLNGSDNTAIGYHALYNNEGSKCVNFECPGWENTAVGSEALLENTTGDYNTAVGSEALRDNTVGRGNTAVGYGAGMSSEGIQNIFLGYMAGRYEKDSKKLHIANIGDVRDTPLIYGDFLEQETPRVGIATTTPRGTLDVNGTAYCDQGFWSGSDKRWKKNIEPLENSLDKVNQLRGVSFEWRIDEYPDEGFTEDKQIGLIAQDVEEVIPEIVHTDYDGYKSISYEKMTVVLVEAIKELEVENVKTVEALKAEISSLKAENESIRREKESFRQEIEQIKSAIGL